MSHNSLNFVLCFNHSKWRRVLLLEVRELNIGFWKDINYDSERKWNIMIWTFFQKIVFDFTRPHNFSFVKQSKQEWKVKVDQTDEMQ